MSRERQRANRRIKLQAQKFGIESPEFIRPKGQEQRGAIRTGQEQRVDKPWLNSEGYHDPTAYQAMRNIERRERAVR